MALNLGFELLGMLIFAFFVFMLSLFIIGLVFLIIAVKLGRYIFPRFLLFSMDIFYMPLIKISSMFNIAAPEIIDTLYLNINNMIELNKFSKIPPCEKMIFLPQCLRGEKCPAPSDYKGEIQCIKCGKCQVRAVKEIAEFLEYKKVALVAGGSAMMRLVKKYNPRGIIGVACHKESRLGISMINGISVLAVPLLRDGCANTAFDMKILLRAMMIGVSEIKKREFEEKFAALPLAEYNDTLKIINVPVQNIL